MMPTYGILHVRFISEYKNIKAIVEDHTQKCMEMSTSDEKEE